VLAQQFLAAAQPDALIAISPAALAQLTAHAWPGNVRELAHTAEKLAIYASSDELSADDAAQALSS
jgi:DNA-binding NtrC family response regulator